jgi:hypothetical protein
MGSRSMTMFFNGGYVLVGTSEMLRLTIWLDPSEQVRDLRVCLCWNDEPFADSRSDSFESAFGVRMVIANLKTLTGPGDSTLKSSADAALGWIDRVVQPLALSGVVTVESTSELCSRTWRRCSPKIGSVGTAIRAA